jgi:hypothetical protein
METMRRVTARLRDRDEIGERREQEGHEHHGEDRK